MEGEGEKIKFNGGGGYLTSAQGSTLSDFQAPLNKLSQSLAALSGTASLPKPTNNETITASPHSNGIAAFNVTSADLSKISSFSIDLNSPSTAVFNVSGSSPSFQANQFNPTTVADNVNWSFYNATSVSLSNRIGGTVLPPKASVSNNNQIDGVLVAKSWSGGGELHNYGFTGALPTGSSVGTLAAVAEPGGLAIFGAGLLVLGWLARTRVTAQPRAAS